MPLKKYDFMDGWFIDTNLCDRIVSWMDEQERQGNTTEGTVSQNRVDKSHKESVDTTFNDPELYNEYCQSLVDVVNEYMKIWPMCNNYSPFGLAERTNVQKYYPSQGFHGWHCERSAIHNPNSSRHLVFMTYLNDIDDGGQTEFYHQKVKVKPRKGLTLIWPSDWTFTHRGITSPTETKYIVTGWLSYLDNGETK